ncbi:MAG TPA: hypothetical protein VGH27_29005 [Streptosporangiaceae bacterium]|jgi:hypothetical protein
MRGSACRKAATFIATLLAATTLMPAATALAAPVQPGAAQAGPVGPAVASKWSIQPTPDATVLNSQIQAVSCSAATDCTAVGQYTNAQGQPVALAESWDGTTWQQQPTPGLALSTPVLLGVSCPTADFCEAVGGGVAHDGARELLVAEVWNGTSWRVQAIPGSATSSYTSVACASADFCVAVGVAAQIAVWNGTSWSAQATPTPAGGYPGLLDSVSCASADFCEAVGSYPGASGLSQTLAEAGD